MLVNPTEQPTKVKANTRIDAAIPLRCQWEGEAESVYTVSRRMVYSRPQLLKTTYDAVKDLTEEAFDQRIQELIGLPSPASAKEATEKRRQIHELFHRQIQANKQLNPAEKQTLESILYRYYGTLSKGKYDVGCTDLLEFEVDMGDSVPVKAKCRPMPPEIKKDFAMALDELLQEGIVRPSQSPWASALVPVCKKDGTWRYAVDYRGLNQVTVTDAFPVAHSLEALADDVLGHAKLYITGDMAGAFLSVPVANGSEDKLAMTTPFGLYAYARMPFGAKTSGNVYATVVAHSWLRIP